MQFAQAVEHFLRQRNIAYELYAFGREVPLDEAARALGFGLGQLARVVFLNDECGVVMAVMTADRLLDIDLLRIRLARPRLDIASASMLCKNLLRCDAGAVPPIAELHRVEAVVDERLAWVDGVWFGAGTGGQLIRVQSDAFQRLHSGSVWCSISRTLSRPRPRLGHTLLELSHFPRTDNAIHFPRRARLAHHT